MPCLPCHQSLSSRRIDFRERWEFLTWLRITFDHKMAAPFCKSQSDTNHVPSTVVKTLACFYNKRLSDVVILAREKWKRLLTRGGDTRGSSAAGLSFWGGGGILQSFLFCQRVYLFMRTHRGNPSENDLVEGDISIKVPFLYCELTPRMIHGLLSLFGIDK